jgi:hypothetical protein
MNEDKDDIVAYLRGWAVHIRSGRPITISIKQAIRLNEAADTIVTLRQQLEAKSLELHTAQESLISSIDPKGGS